MPSDKSPHSGDFLTDFGRYVKKRRGEKSLSQQSLAELSNLSDRTIREIEMGKGRETLHARTYETLLLELDGPEGERNIQEFRQCLHEQRENDDVGNAFGPSGETRSSLNRETSQASQPTRSRTHLGLGTALVGRVNAVFRPHCSLFGLLSKMAKLVG
jgi:transcriptional regulator with XRE-family HTH domain